MKDDSLQIKDGPPISVKTRGAGETEPGANGNFANFGSLYVLHRTNTAAQYFLSYKTVCTPLL
jgi:hypothetical protein